MLLLVILLHELHNLQNTIINMSASAESNENLRSKVIAEDLYNGIRVLRVKKQM